MHIDGYIAPVASTVVVGGGEVTGKKADVIMAAYTAAEVALRMMRPGCKVSACSLNCVFAPTGALKHAPCFSSSVRRQ